MECRTGWSRLRAAVRRLHRPVSWERALDDELRACLDQEIGAKIRAGQSPIEARRVALAQFGGIEPVKEQVRAGVSGAWLDRLWQDTRYGWRALRSSRGYAFCVVGSLSIGMAVTVAALALLNATMVLPFPQVSDQHRLVRLQVSRNCGRPDCWRRMSTPADYAALQDGLSGLQGLAGYTQGDVAVGIPDARSMNSLITTVNYFEVLGVRPALGRAFQASDQTTQAAVALLSHATWTREFNADPLVTSRTIRVADQFVQIVGVAPEHFTGIDRLRPGGRAPDLWLPMWLVDRVLPMGSMSAAEQRRPERDVAFVGRLRDDVAIASLEAETRVVALRLATLRDPSTEAARSDVARVWRVRPESWHFGVIIVMPIPILVLVIACVNAANLMLARGSQRQREMAIRLAIGAGRGRIVRQLLIESAMLAGVATSIAVPIAWWGMQLASHPLNQPIPFDPLVLTLTIATAVGTTLAFGLLPAMRVSAQRPSSTLGPAGARDDAAPWQSRMRRALVVMQVALSLALLATAWQLVATVRAQAVSSGTPAERLLIARLDLAPFTLPPAEAESLYRGLAAGASRLPGVEATGLARHASVWTFGQGPASGSVVVWQPADAAEEGRLTGGGYAGGELFDAVGLRVLSGRGFTEADRSTRPQVAVVNQSFADSMQGPAVGSLLRVASRDQSLEMAVDVRIVGVIEGAVEPRLMADGPPPPKVYLPSPLQPEAALSLYIRTRGSATAVAQPFRELVGQLAPRVPILELGSLDELNERSYGQQLWLARAAAFLGILGLLLATAGLYAVSSYVVAMRSREIAIRMAIGARPGAILRMMLGQSMRVALFGLVTGAAAAVTVGRVIQSEYHGIVGIDPTAFGGAMSLFVVAMLLASAFPALRASRVDPVRNLKDA